MFGWYQNVLKATGMESDYVGSRINVLVRPRKQSLAQIKNGSRQET